VTRVLLADDNEFVLGALGDLLKGTGDFDVVALCHDGDEVVAAAAHSHPDVAVLDVAMPRVDGLEATRRLVAAQPGARVIILSAKVSAAALHAARRVGACGYLLKAEDPEQLLRALHTVAAGGTAWWADTDNGTGGGTALVADRIVATPESDDATD
jgi:DNA-binding NarL/FixJ family response regulator